MSALTGMRSRLRRGSHPGEAAEPGRASEESLAAERDRLATRFTVMQSELGGLFYEMAIRDHVRLDVLLPKAAALQRLDAELAQVEHLLADGASAVGGRCGQCGTAHARGAAFCAHCGQALGS